MKTVTLLLLFMVLASALADWVEVADHEEDIEEDSEISDFHEEGMEFEEELYDIDHGDDSGAFRRLPRSAPLIDQSRLRKVTRKRKVARTDVSEEENQDEQKKRKKVLKKVLRRKVQANGRFGPHITSIESARPQQEPPVRKMSSQRVRPALFATSEDNQGAIATEDDTRRRNGRFFSLFTVVRFNNDPCPTSSGRNGTCYTSSDCSARGGRTDGSCASGFGVCCFFEFQCGSTTSENGTYFVNPTSPQRICNLMVNRLNDDICQIRLDLEKFELSQPNDVGECVTDFFLVTGGSQVPQICGINTGQHLIYSITPNSGPSTLSIVLDTLQTSTASRTWQIKITQLECSSRLLAPVGCLQYYTAASGVLQSFNFRTETTNDQVNHLANLNYAICIRVENGYCGIKYAQDTTDAFSFTLTKNTAPNQTPAMLQAGIKVGEAQCSTDYIIITNGSQDGGFASGSAKDRYCGTALGRCFRATPQATSCTNAAGSVTTFSRPFNIQVITDADETGDTANRGFKLTYSQQPCLGMIG